VGLGFRFRVYDLDKVEVVLEGIITRRRWVGARAVLVGWFICYKPANCFQHPNPIEVDHDANDSDDIELSASFVCMPQPLNIF